LRLTSTTLISSKALPPSRPLGTSKSSSCITNANSRYWSERDKIHRVNEIYWFIKKGDPVEEAKPAQISFSEYWPVGQTSCSIKMTVWCDEKSATAPVHKGLNGRDLVTLRAELSNLSVADFESLRTTTCADGKRYYKVPGAIEATFHSASTKYVMLCLGRRFDTVSAEYA
jgi:hypothetical protein